MVTNGFLKIDNTFLKTQSIKESEFDSTNFPSALKDMEDFTKRPTSAQTSEVPSPNLNSYAGVKIGASSTVIGSNKSFGVVSERPQINNLQGYYFPLGSDIKGSSLSDIRSSLLKPVDKVETIQEDFEKEDTAEYRKDPMFIFGGGIIPCSNQINNLLDAETVRSAWSNATTEILANTPFSASDGLTVYPVTMTSDTEGTYEVIPESSGYYCFSFYARLDGRSYNPLNVTRYIKMSISPGVTDSYIISEDAQSLSNSSILFTLKFEWLRYAAVAYLTEGTQYTIKLNWFYRDTASGISGNNYRASKLKIAGILLEQRKWPSSYEVRKSNISGSSSIPNDIYHLAVFDLDSLANNISQNKGWIISYKRKIEDNQASNTVHYDSLGDMYWGYFGDQIIASNFGGEESPSVSTNDFYLKWEQVILRHIENASEVDVYVEATNSNKEYFFKIDISNLNLRKEFRGQEYNLMLGCKDDQISNISNATYRDLLYILDGDDSSLQKIKNNIMGLFTSEAEIVINDIKTTEKAIVLTNMNIVEKANLEY